MLIHYPIAEGILPIQYIKAYPQQPTIIFLHDALGCGRTWKDFPQRLAAATTCNYLSYDRLGHGEASAMLNSRNKDYLSAEAEILLAIIEKLALEKVILFGHSDGGSIALLAAAQTKHKLLGVIAEAAHVFVEAVTLQGITAAQTLYAAGNLRERLSVYHGTKTDTLFKAWADTWLAEDFRDWSIEHWLPQITCPCLAIQGQQDEYASLEQLQRIEKAMKARVALKWLANVGHVPHKEQTDLVLDICTEFINNLI